MNIKYQVQFHSDWHCGSGLAAGADLDALVVKDRFGLPYIPGKTIKGLIRGAVEELLFIDENQNIDDVKRDLFKKTFGNSKDRNIILQPDNKNDENDENRSDNYSKVVKGDTFFTNVSLPESEAEAISANNASRFMYRSVASTAIKEDGIAMEHSLRKTEVVVPCILIGEIKGIPAEFTNEIRNALKFIKRLGLGRHRGLGRCTITVLEEGGDK